MFCVKLGKNTRETYEMIHIVYGLTCICFFDSTKGSRAVELWWDMMRDVEAREISELESWLRWRSSCICKDNKPTVVSLMWQLYIVLFSKIWTCEKSVQCFFPGFIVTDRFKDALVTAGGIVDSHSLHSKSTRVPANLWQKQHLLLWSREEETYKRAYKENFVITPPQSQEVQQEFRDTTDII